MAAGAAFPFLVIAIAAVGGAAYYLGKEDEAKEPAATTSLPSNFYESEPLLTSALDHGGRFVAAVYQTPQPAVRAELIRLARENPQVRFGYISENEKVGVLPTCGPSGLAVVVHQGSESPTCVTTQEQIVPMLEQVLTTALAEPPWKPSWAFKVEPREWQGDTLYYAVVRDPSGVVTEVGGPHNAAQLAELAAIQHIQDHGGQAVVWS